MSDERDLVDALVDDAEREAEADADGHERPDFASVVARAHRIDPESVSLEDVDDAQELARARDADVGGDAMREPIDPLAAFVAAARAEAEDDVARREAAGVPPVRRTAPAPRWALVGMGLGLAAAVVLVLLGPQGWRAIASSVRSEPTQAVAELDATTTMHEVDAVTDDLPKAPRRIATPRVAGGLTPAPLESVEPPREVGPIVPEEPAPLERLAPASVPAAAAKPAPRKRTDTVLAELDARASARLAEGDLAGAEKAYRELCRRGGSSARVESAYADRFVIARRLGDADARAQLWREYLDRFPRGRYADDARAGLCRVAPTGERDDCWRAYVREFPAGAYRPVAERAIGASGAAP
jgi:hypothetical protein